MNAKSPVKTIVVGVAVSLAVLLALAGCKEEPAKPTEPNQTQQVTAAVEQTICPVLGGAIDKNVYTEYKGKKVYFCCPMCKPEFEKNPEKYVGKLPQFKE